MRHSFERALQSPTWSQHSSDAIIDARTVLTHHQNVGHATMSRLRIHDRSGHKTRALITVQYYCSRCLFEVYSGIWFECTTLHSPVRCSPKSQGVVTPAAPDGLFVVLWGPVVGIHCELLTWEVWAVAEFADAEQS